MTSLVVTNDPRLLLMAQVQEWRHVVLEGGVLHAVEEHEPTGVQECTDAPEEGARAEANSADDKAVQLVQGPGEIPNVVPFPVTARAGGAE